MYNSVSLWSERVYMLSVNSVEVPEPHSLNVVLIEEDFDLHPSWTQASPIGYSTRIADGVQILPPTRAQSADIKYPDCIPTIPRMLDALLDQARFRATHADDFPRRSGRRPQYNLQNFVRYLHLEKPEQREKLLPKLAERSRGEMEAAVNTFTRKPLLTLASLENIEHNKNVP